VAEQRGLAARVGVTLLNLLAPGLGLLRIGRLQPALVVYGAALGALLVFVAALSTTKNISFGAYAALAGFLLVVTLATYTGAMWRTWRDSRHLILPRSVWARWYSIIGAALTAFALSWALTGISQTLYRNFYVPSEAMEPTLYKNDRFVASMRQPSGLRRGDLILVRAPGDAIYIKRLAALPGDTIELKRGVVFINGARSKLRPERTKRVSYPYLGATNARLYGEQFPGEAGFHHIQDLGTSETDEVSEIKIPPDHVFVLGDNRDNSADSRVSKVMGGLELVPVKDVIGRALFMYWPLAKMGRPLRGER
jgi:signal peptidase I